MNYDETIKFLYNQLPIYQKIGNRALNKGLFNIKKLTSKLDNPHKSFKVIHIAGTNGKGSSAHSIASICQENGIKTGLYTSPHLISFRERIKINGEKISKNHVIKFVENNIANIKKINPSFFELTVAMAFKHFNEKKVEIAIIEVGLGGELDSTNIVNPFISLITNIGLDHKEILGSTIKKIAIEKSGIIKKDGLTIIGEKQHEIKNVFINKANTLNNKLYFASDIIKIRINKKDKNKINIHLKLNNKIYENRIEINSNYYLKNLPGIILVSYLILKYYKINSINPFKGLSKVKFNTGILGRWEILSRKPKIICDICHNTEGFREVLIDLNKLKFNQIYFIIGGVKTKDWNLITDILPKNYKYLLCEPKTSRAIKTTSLSIFFQNNNLDYKIINNSIKALNYAELSAQPEDLIFIGGSFFLVSEILKEWEKRN